MTNKLGEIIMILIKYQHFLNTTYFKITSIKSFPVINKLSFQMYFLQIQHKYSL